MSSIASALGKPFRFIGNATVPRRLADGVSKPPWSWRAAAFAVAITCLGFMGVPVLLHRLWHLGATDVLCPELVLSIPMLCSLRYLARRAGTTAVKAFGLSGVRVGWMLLSSVLLFVLGLILFVATSIALERLGFKGQSDKLEHTSVFFILDMTVFGPVLEELWFRGLVYTSLRTRLGVGSSAVITAAAFALGHGPSSFHKMGVLFVDGLLNSIWYERTRSLWPNMISHSLQNTIFALG